MKISKPNNICTQTLSPTLHRNLNDFHLPYTTTHFIVEPFQLQQTGSYPDKTPKNLTKINKSNYICTQTISPTLHKKLKDFHLPYT